jgi:hypothetical protein
MSVIQISTKSVHNHVEKRPLDMPEVRMHAAFNNLPVARASCEHLKKTCATVRAPRPRRRA